VHELLFSYFPSISEDQKNKFGSLEGIYALWNSRINVISRKDFGNFYLHHVLHSLAIAKIISFRDGTKVLDVGTGGGFPGVPLAILFPNAEFTLMDSIEKKIKVVSAVAQELGLQNVLPVRKRVEDEKGKFDFVVSRAVTAFPAFAQMVSKNILKDNRNDLKNGIMYLKGGDIIEELGRYRPYVSIHNIGDFYREPFFATKKIVYLPV
jgi:16S rRNA (guanine527-N7)-methyltransferase